MLLGQSHAQGAFGERVQTELVPSEQTGGELGVEQGGRGHSPILQAGQVLGDGVDDPFVLVESGNEEAEVLEYLGVDEEGAGPLPSQLVEEGPVTVSDARRPLGVDGDRSLPGGQAGDRGGQLLSGVDDVWDAVGGCFQKRWFRCHRRRPGRAVTPSGSGGSPATVLSRSIQASK